MSRIGKNPVKVPEKVKATFDAGTRMMKIEGPKGKLEVHVAKGVEAVTKGSEVIVTRPDDSPTSKSLHGLTRPLIAHAMFGVTTGW